MDVEEQQIGNFFDVFKSVSRFAEIVCHLEYFSYLDRLSIFYMWSHSGNKNFRKLVKEYQGFYLRARKQDKLKVAKAVVKKVRANGGRFLKRHSASIDGVVWVDIGNDEAITKAAQCLR